MAAFTSESVDTSNPMALITKNVGTASNLLEDDIQALLRKNSYYYSPISQHLSLISTVLVRLPVMTVPES